MTKRNFESWTNQIFIKEKALSLTYIWINKCLHCELFCYSQWCPGAWCASDLCGARGWCQYHPLGAGVCHRQTAGSGGGVWW